MRKALDKVGTLKLGKCSEARMVHKPLYYPSDQVSFRKWIHVDSHRRYTASRSSQVPFGARNIRIPGWWFFFGLIPGMFAVGQNAPQGESTNGLQLFWETRSNARVVKLWARPAIDIWKLMTTSIEFTGKGWVWGFASTTGVSSNCSGSPGGCFNPEIHIQLGRSNCWRYEKKQLVCCCFPNRQPLAIHLCSIMLQWNKQLLGFASKFLQKSQTNMSYRFPK